MLSYVTLRYVMLCYSMSRYLMLRYSIPRLGYAKNGLCQEWVVPRVGYTKSGYPKIESNPKSLKMGSTLGNHSWKGTLEAKNACDFDLESFVCRSSSMCYWFSTDVQ